jgi:hypothetical protein
MDNVWIMYGLCMKTIWKKYEECMKAKSDKQEFYYQKNAFNIKKC